MPTFNHHPAERGGDVVGDFGGDVDSAYVPSGAQGDMTALMLHGFAGVLAGYGAAGACFAAAYALNLVHNLLPVYIFVVPIFIVGLMALAPVVYGIALSHVVGKGAVQARHRHPGSAGLVALAAALLGIACFLPLVTVLLTPSGQSFLDDVLLPFVRLMIGGCLNFQWGNQPEPVNVPAWVVYGVLGTTALMGLLVAYGGADDAIRRAPFCEQCQSYLHKQELWQVPATKLPLVRAAFKDLDFGQIKTLPYCVAFENHIAVETWQCGCGQTAFVELTGKNKDEPGVRLYSRPLTALELEQLQACAPGLGG